MPTKRNPAELLNDKSHKTTGWRIPAVSIGRFMKFCDKQGTSYETALAAAMELFPVIPAHLQTQAVLQAKGEGQIDYEFWELLARAIDESAKQSIVRIKKKS